MNASSTTSALRSTSGGRMRLHERPDGPGGPGRAVERWWLLLWRWETWASESELERRPRAGWALTYKKALVASQDALDDYALVDVPA